VSDPRVEVQCGSFSFTIAVCTAKAPISGGYFLADVDSRALDGSAIFRIVNLHNQPADHPAKIEVIQMGHREDNPEIPATIQHEPTGITGLRHRRGVVSLARYAPGAAYHSCQHGHVENRKNHHLWWSDSPFRSEPRRITDICQYQRVARL
jgi:peptidyl-prolyl cis-trans isomerase A (cyclophilin A)